MNNALALLFFTLSPFVVCSCHPSLFLYVRIFVVDSSLFIYEGECLVFLWIVNGGGVIFMKRKGR